MQGSSVALTHHSYSIQEQIGSGSAGTVFIAKRQASQKGESQYFALKRVRVREDGSSESHKGRRQFGVELALMLQLDHPGVLKALDYRVSLGERGQSSELWMLSEWGRGGTFQRLLELVRDRQEFRAEAEAIHRYYIAQLVSIVEYLHCNRVAHRDLKPDNFILSHEYKLKLIDFGSAQAPNHLLSCPATVDLQPCSQAEGDKGYVGSRHFISPEMIEKGRSRGDEEVDALKADLWSLGVILYYIAAGEYPFDGSNSYFILDHIQHSQPDLSKLRDPHLKSITQKLLSKQPSRRITISQVKSSPYFQNIAFEEVFREESPVISITERMKDTYLFKGQAIVSIGAETKKRVVGIFRKLIEEISRQCSLYRFYLTIGRLDSRTMPKLLPLTASTVLRVEEGKVALIWTQAATRDGVELPREVSIRLYSQDKKEAFLQGFREVKEQLSCSQ